MLPAMSSEGAKAFIARWAAASASERANSQPFLCELCDMLGVARPEPTRETGYAFEYDVTEHHPDGSTTKGRIDLYRRECFVLESKQFLAAKAEASQLELAAQEAGVIEKKKSSQPVRGTGAWDDAMVKARGQAERYVRALPANEPNPPFLLVVDVGHSFEVFADFTQAGKAYLPFPDPRTFRIRLEHLADEKVRERLKLIWTHPAALDPALQSANVTREISAHLAELAKSLEEAGHRPRVVADFLTRCLFCMFAEDVGLLPERSFTDLLNSLPADGSQFPELVVRWRFFTCARAHLWSDPYLGWGRGPGLMARVLGESAGYVSQEATTNCWSRGEATATPRRSTSSGVGRPAPPAKFSPSGGTKRTSNCSVSRFCSIVTGRRWVRRWPSWSRIARLPISGFRCFVLLELNPKSLAGAASTR
jgi:hypothetical protein